MLLGTGYKAENIKEYRYFDSASKSLDFSGMCEDLKVIMKSFFKHDNCCCTVTCKCNMSGAVTVIRATYIVSCT